MYLITKVSVVYWGFLCRLSMISSLFQGVSFCITLFSLEGVGGGGHIVPALTLTNYNF